MELVGPTGGVVSGLWPSLAHRINYFKNLKKNFTKLEKGVEALFNLKNDIVLEIASDTSKILSKECQGWTEEVDKIVTKVNEIKVEVDENRRCLNGCCFPNICARIKLGKRIVTMLGDVEEHKKEADFKGPKYVDAPPAVVEEIPLPVIKGGEPAIERTVKCIMQRIMDAKIQKIGLWGMGGVGKTTALNSLNNLPGITKKFQVVIWVTVSKEGSVRKVQNEIARRLQINIFDSEAEEITARKLFEKLRTKKYLILLDDLWSPMKLEDVGIPLQEESKVVLTTRILDVCRNMETDEEIKVECLSKEEAWNLFREKVGQVVDSPSIESIARDVLDECGGLPLAVVVIGRSLRKVEDVYVWQDALNQLKSATSQFGDTEAGLFDRLKLSYDQLKDVEQICFLYCALYPEDYEIRVAELVKLWGPEGFTFRGGMDSLDDADARGHTIVNNLVDASLLERTEDEDEYDCVKMHDVLRDLALRITSSKFLVRAGLGIEKEWEEAHRISLMKNKLSGLPTNPRCNELSTLLLREYTNLNGNIPDMFFQHMHNLRVLDLCKTSIEALPASVSSLVNLRGLYMTSRWMPVDLPREIGALEKFEVLHVSVGSLPLEVRQLTSLRRLWVKFNKDKEEAMRTICSNGVISNLFLLEDLRIYFEDDDDDLRKEWCKLVDVSRVAEEVGRLKRLAKLQFDFSTIEYLEHFLIEQRNTNSFPGLKDFHLSMTGSDGLGLTDIPKFGQEMKKKLIWNWGERESSPKVMSQMLNQALQFNLMNHKTATNLRSICEDPRHMFSKLTMLYIIKCQKLTCVFTQIMIQHMPNLEVIHVFDCEGIEEIVREDVKKDHVQLFFPRLRNLELEGMKKLVRIWKGASQPWPSIEDIQIYRCPNLENLNLNAVDEKNPPARLTRILGKREWWEALKWEDEKSKHRLQPLFIRRW